MCLSSVDKTNQDRPSCCCCCCLETVLQDVVLQVFVWGNRTTVKRPLQIAKLAEHYAAGSLSNMFSVANRDLTRCSHDSLWHAPMTLMTSVNCLGGESAASISWCYASTTAVGTHDNRVHCLHSWCSGGFVVMGTLAERLMIMHTERITPVLCDEWLRVSYLSPAIPLTCHVGASSSYRSLYNEQMLWQFPTHADTRTHKHTSKIVNMRTLRCE